MPHSIRTERLLLRPLELRDARAFTAACNDPDILRMTAGWPLCFDEAYARARFRQARAMTLPDEIVFAIVWQGRVMGTIGLHDATASGRTEPGEALLGYMVGKEAWGQGLMSEAVRAVCAFAFRTLRRTRIVAEHFHDNPASGRVLAKAGFVCTGEATPVYSMARAGYDGGLRHELIRERLLP